MQKPSIKRSKITMRSHNPQSNYSQTNLIPRVFCFYFLPFYLSWGAKKHFSYTNGKKQNHFTQKLFTDAVVRVKESKCEENWQHCIDFISVWVVMELWKQLPAFGSEFSTKGEKNCLSWEKMRKSSRSKTNTDAASEKKLDENSCYCGSNEEVIHLWCPESCT